MKTEICKQLLEKEVEWLSEKNRLKLLRQQIRVMDDLWSPDLLTEIIKWCNENCEDVYYNVEQYFYFLDEGDMLAFRLRWSE